jgi:hypothetical protein
MNKMDKPSMDQYLPKIDREKIERMLEIRRLYDDGKITLEEGRARLKAEVGSIRAYELAFAEQEFKAFEDDECRKEDIQAMMDLYQDIWDTSRPDLPADHPLMCYYRENDAMRKHLLAVEDLVQYPVIRNQWYELYDELAKFKIHLSRKQNQLYSLLERKGFDRPTTTMWLLDDFIRDEIRDTRKLLEDGKEEEFIEKQKMIVADIRDLMQKEEQVLYPTSLVMIKPEEFEDMKEGDREIGFAWIEVKPTETGTKSQTSTSGSSDGLEKDLLALLAKHGYAANAPHPDEKLEVATGKLTLEQINLIFRHLPVDLSYVDENELVCFYSDTEHRVFPRSKNVIGRDVKNCHPRTSVHIVEEIIQKFRSGEADTVDFWINKPGFFVYITYTAVRDEHGRFRGILEMMQNCTHIRALEGSRTLLVWSKSENGETTRIEEEVTMEEEEKTRDVPAGIDRKTMVVTAETRLKDLLAVCPELKGELPKINSSFKMLSTPLARVMIPKANVGMMSERSGMPLADLIKAIEEVLRR